VPPLGADCALPLLLPLQLTLFTTVALAKSTAAGCVIVTLPVAVHPCASVTVKVYVPALKPLMLEVVAPLLHAYVYAGVPPLGADCALPLLLPLQLTLFTTVAFANNTAAGWVIVTLPVAVHPCASVTIKVYVPALKPLMLEVVAPLLHAYVYAGVPPLGADWALPLLLPLQLTLLTTVALAKSTAAGCVIVTLPVAVHPWESCTVKV
jgi:hypothetical protein